jgi:DNA mismatch repair protein MutL
VHEFVRKSMREALRAAGAEIGVVSQPMFSSGPSRSGGGGPPDAAAPRHIQRDLWGGESLASRGAVAEAPGAYGSSPAARPTRPGDGAKLAGARVIGTTSDGYVLMEAAGELRIMDPHAIHERLIYDSLAAAAEGRPAESQSLLVPETVELTPSELGVFAKAKESLDALGFEADLFGGRTVAVRAVPTGLAPSSSAEVLREVLDDIESGGSGSSSSMLERVRKSIACRAAVKLGTRLDASEIAWLLDDAHDAPKTCPHGRPFAWAIPASEIARRLGRS